LTSPGEHPGDVDLVEADKPAHQEQRYPHPYFGRKILVFFRLQTGLRCKIFITKKFPAKYSWIRSYGTFWLHFAASGWKTG
jgi:hypothetical protein